MSGCIYILRKDTLACLFIELAGMDLIVCDSIVAPVKLATVVLLKIKHTLESNLIILMYQILAEIFD